MFDFTIQKQSTIKTYKSLYDLIIIGGGPAGLNAALYAKRKGLDILLIAKELGGQLHNTTTVDNYLGHILLSGDGLSDAFVKHVSSLSVDIRGVKTIKKENNDFIVILENGEVLNSKTVLLATGSTPKKLGITGEDTYAAHGISYCTICDAPFYKGKHVVVAGGGNSAVEAALDLVPYAKHITIIHRSQFRADQSLLDKLKLHPQITVMLETQITGVFGKEHLNYLALFDKQTQTKKVFETEGLFIAIGNNPNTSLLNDLVEMNAFGEIIVDYNQIIIAAADGAKAALGISHYLTYTYKEKTHGI